MHSFVYFFNFVRDGIFRKYLEFRLIWFIWLHLYRAFAQIYLRELLTLFLVYFYWFHVSVFGLLFLDTCYFYATCGLHEVLGDFLHLIWVMASASLCAANFGLLFSFFENCGTFLIIIVRHFILLICIIIYLWIKLMFFGKYCRLKFKKERKKYWNKENT